ncbi:DUF3040 domain-containing protein [Streptomyces sp. NPDC090052]|uniref:DUF3040 domain-containing protein n=1 Tax=unclassified Streptomyces TaxID=2593676 RepID=UPI002E2511F3|nr:DUF3040 domain-containing protein [Streptomyces sp. NBC_01020]
MAVVDGPPLSKDEQQTLSEIEATLAQDPELDRRLSAAELRPLAGRRKPRRSDIWLMVVLGVAWVCLLAASLRTGSLAVLGACACTGTAAVAVTTHVAARTWRRPSDQD